MAVKHILEVGRVLPVTDRYDVERELSSLQTPMKVPFKYQVAEGFWQQPEDRFAITSNGEFHGVVSAKWNPVSHKEMILQAYDTLEADLGKPDGFRIRADGPRASAEFLFDAGALRNQDSIAAGVRVSNSYIPGTSISLGNMAIRSACANGMLFQEFEETFNMNHLQVDWTDAIQSRIDIIAGRNVVFKDRMFNWVESSKDDIIPWEGQTSQVMKFLESNLSERMTKKIIAHPDWGVPSGITEFSRWDLYNLVTAAGTHLTRSERHYVEINKVAEKVLTTPMEALLSPFQEYALA